MDFANLAYWHWWVLAGALLIVELAAAGTFYLLWVAAAAAAVGVLMVALDIGWPVQFALFALLSVGSLALWHRYKPAAPASDQPALNRRGHSYVGRVFSVAEPIVNGVGKLHVDDSQWRISGADAPAGSRVRVIGVEGATLKVERAD